MCTAAVSCIYNSTECSAATTWNLLHAHFLLLTRLTITVFRY